MEYVLNSELYFSLYRTNNLIQYRFSEPSSMHTDDQVDHSQSLISNNCSTVPDIPVSTCLDDSGFAEGTAAIISSGQEETELRDSIVYSTKFLSFASVECNDKLVAHLTGLPDSKTFYMLLGYGLCNRFEINYYLGWKVEQIEPREQLFITLRKLRANTLQETLAWEYSVSPTTIRNIIMTWLHVLWEILFKGFMDKMPSRQKNEKCLPEAFNSFKNCRVTIDCTEIHCSIATKFSDKSATYSHYKHYHTYKALVGVAPNGVITFVSDLYPGSSSDKAITTSCGLLSQLQEGDMILADKGFLISDVLPKGTSVNLPPFLCTTQFTPEQCIKTSNIARARVHVERANCRIKNFKILQFIPNTYQNVASKLFQTCCALVNLQNPLINEIRENLI